VGLEIFELLLLVFFLAFYGNYFDKFFPF